MLKGRIHQSVCQWCFGSMPVRELAERSKRMGLLGIEMVAVEHWPMLKDLGLICPTILAHGISDGLNRKENHEKCLAAIGKSIDAASDAAFPNVVCFSGNRAGMGDDEGLKNCIAALKQVAPLAERKKITVCMELLNSKRDHADYMCDHTAWGVELIKAVASPRVKLLYDIYHMQVQEGDVIASIRQHKDHIAHYHTAGCPGRHELDENQELNYPAIMRAILETGYQGYVGQEFIPVRDPMTSLEQAVGLCDV